MLPTTSKLNVRVTADACATCIFIVVDDVVRRCCCRRCLAGCLLTRFLRGIPAWMKRGSTFLALSPTSALTTLFMLCATRRGTEPNTCACNISAAFTVWRLFVFAPPRKAFAIIQKCQSSPHSNFNHQGINKWNELIYIYIYIYIWYIYTYM